MENEAVTSRSETPPCSRLNIVPKHLRNCRSEAFDLLVIGGGITGVGIALDAAGRGLKVALIEKQDFAAGTSSRSTKLIHGGLRYLKQSEFGLVREVGQERKPFTTTLHIWSFQKRCCFRSRQMARSEKCPLHLESTRTTG